MSGPRGWQHCWTALTCPQAGQGHTHSGVTWAPPSPCHNGSQAWLIWQPATRQIWESSTTPWFRLASSTRRKLPSRQETILCSPALRPGPLPSRSSRLLGLRLQAQFSQQGVNQGRSRGSCLPSVRPTSRPTTLWMLLPTCRRGGAFNYRLPGQRTCHAPTPWFTTRSAAHMRCGPRPQCATASISTHWCVHGKVS